MSAALLLLLQTYTAVTKPGCLQPLHLCMCSTPPQRTMPYPAASPEHHVQLLAACSSPLHSSMSLQTVQVLLWRWNSWIRQLHSDCSDNRSSDRPCCWKAALPIHLAPGANGVAGTYIPQEILVTRTAL
jgi:hypothetical protein